MNIRDEVVKRDQKRMREMIREAKKDGSTEIERAMAMFMEADTYLRSQGVVVRQPTHPGGAA